MKSLFSIFFLIFATNCIAVNDVIKRVYIDKFGNVNVIASFGKKMKLNKHGKAIDARLSEDKRTVAWLTAHTWIAEGDSEPGASKLTVYRDGKSQDIECQPFIRHYWFWDGGKKVGIDCGGRHFAGTLALYDVDTGNVVESVLASDVPLEKRPAWTMGH